jgi:hypothetical protein
MREFDDFDRSRSANGIGMHGERNVPRLIGGVRIDDNYRT